MAATLPQRVPTSADAFRMTVGTAVYDKRPGAGQALQATLAALARDLGYQREVTVPAGSLGGLPVEALAARRTTGIELTLRCQGVPYTSIEITVDALHDDTKAVGLVTRLENRINALDHRHVELADESARIGVEITRAQARIGAEFPHAGELSAAILRAADVAARLIEAAAHTSRPPPEQSGSHDLSPPEDVDDTPDWDRE